jgi:magnesium chelatase family protein
MHTKLKLRSTALAATQTFGLPDAAVKESRDRVTTAIANSGYFWPRGHTTINLAPADIKKEERIEPQRPRLRFAS